MTEYQRYRKVLDRVNLCMRCHKQERYESTVHCVSCLEYFTSRHVPKTERRGRRTKCSVRVNAFLRSSYA